MRLIVVALVTLELDISTQSWEKTIREMRIETATPTARAKMTQMKVPMTWMKTKMKRNKMKTKMKRTKTMRIKVNLVKMKTRMKRAWLTMKFLTDKGLQSSNAWSPNIRTSWRGGERGRRLAGSRDARQHGLGLGECRTRALGLVSQAGQDGMLTMPLATMGPPNIRTGNKVHDIDTAFNHAACTQQLAVYNLRGPGHAGDRHSSPR